MLSMSTNLTIADHPLISHKLTLLRDKETGSKKVRELVEELTMLLIYEVTRDIPLKEINIETPVGKTRSRIISEKKQVLVPVLRAGLGMVQGALKIMPAAKVGHYGVYRDHQTKKPVEYYSMLPPDMNGRSAILLDPMLATGGSAISAVSFLKKNGAEGIKVACLIASSEGVKALEMEHPETPIYAAALDQGLNQKAYIVPGMGDAGDRLYGTY